MLEGWFHEQDRTLITGHTYNTKIISDIIRMWTTCSPVRPDSFRLTALRWPLLRTVCALLRLQVCVWNQHLHSYTLLCGFDQLPGPGPHGVHLRWRAADCVLPAASQAWQLRELQGKNINDAGNLSEPGRLTGLEQSSTVCPLYLTGFGLHRELTSKKQYLRWRSGAPFCSVRRTLWSTTDQSPRNIRFINKIIYMNNGAYR